MARKSDPSPLSPELCEVVPEFIDEYRYGSPKTLAFYRDHVERALMGYLTAREIRTLLEITPAVMREFLMHEAQSTYTIGRQVRVHSIATVRHRHAASSRFFEWCVDQEYLEVSPMRRVRRPRGEQRARVGFSREEARKLVQEAGKGSGWIGARDRAIVLLLLDTGARANELLTLTPDSFDWPHRRVLLHGKGAKDRRVPLGPKAAAALRSYLRVRPEGPFTMPNGTAQNVANLWVTQRRSVMAYGTLNEMLKALGSYTGIEGVTPHRFRHTYATEWYQHHKDVMALKNLLGHSKVETTQRYLRTLGVDYGTGDEYESPSNWLG